MADLCVNRLRLSMFGVTEESMEEYYRKLVRFKPHFIYGYVSAIDTFTRYLAATRKPLPKSMKCIITTSEILDSDTRSFLEEVTGLRVFNEYGCGEVGSIAHECESGNLHIMSDNLVVECIPQPNLPDGLGELVVTDLFNRAMPLIRYRIGDLGQISAIDCPCGRPYPVLERIVGRAYDIVYDMEGRAYHPEAVLYVFEDLRRKGTTVPPFQVVQLKHGELVVRFKLCQGEEFPIERGKELQAAFNMAFRDAMQVKITRVAALPREASGKFRVVKQIQSEES